MYGGSVAGNGYINRVGMFTRYVQIVTSEIFMITLSSYLGKEVAPINRKATKR